MPQNNSQQSNSHPFDFLWRRWGDQKDWQDRLYRSAAHKALDVPEDMGDINVRNGLGAKEILALSALGLTTGGLGVGAALLWSFLNSEPDVQPQPEPTPVVQPDDRPDADTRYRMQFVDPR